MSALIQAVTALHLHGIAEHPYCLRHGGASHDRGTAFRSLAEVAKRGRWRSAASVRRYEKHGRLAAQLWKLSAGTLVRVQRLAAELPAACGRRCGPPSPALPPAPHGALHMTVW